jgi:hypothetical protein
MAPEEGYRHELIKRRARIKDGIREFEDRIISDSSPQEFYFLRIRTVLDKDGNIISANYAKIYRGFEWHVNGSIKFQYHFNPRPNDRNLEFDPNKNLLNLPEEYRVMEP